MLRNHGDHFRVPEQNLSHLARRLGAGIERDGRGHLRSDPEIALLQRRKKFRAEPRRDENADNQEDQPAADRDLAVVQRPAQSGRIGLAQLAHDPGLDLLDMLREHERRQNRRHRESREQGAKQCVGVCTGHGAENLSFDAGHCEQRQKGGDGDRRGEKHRLIDLQGADENQPQAIGPGRGVVDALLACRVAAELAFGEMVEQRSPFLLGRLKIAKNILDENHRGIDNDAEVDRAHREKIGVLALNDQNDDREKQREGNVDADDDRAAKVAEKNPLNEKHQRAAEKQTMQHGVRRHLDERAAVVIGLDLDAWRQCAVVIDFLDFLLNLGENVVRVLRAPHQHDGRRDIVVVIAAGDPETRNEADVDRRDILDLHRHAIGLREGDILDVLGSVALGEIVAPAVVDKTHAANIHGLLSDADFAAANVDVGVSERGDDLRNRDVIRFQLPQIHVDIELLGRAAPGVDLHDAGNGQQAARDNPVLDRAQIGQSEVRRSLDLIAVDFAGQTGLLNLRRLIAGKRDVLLKRDRRLLIGEIVIHAIFEGHAHEAQAVERSRAHVDHAGHGIERDLHRDRIIFFHLFRRKARGLRGDFENDRRGVRIGFDVQLREREQTGSRENDHAEDDDCAAREPEC